MPMNAGKVRRMARLVDSAGRTVILPLDIVVPVGRFDGAADTGALLDMACAGGVSAVLLRWGEAKRYADRIAAGAGLIVRVSGSTSVKDGFRWPALLNTVEASLAIGGDAVCIDVEIGGGHEEASMRTLAKVCEEAEKLGTVVVAEVHLGTANPEHQTGRTESLAWGARTVQELGADLVKLPFSGPAADMAEICELAQIPVVMAGGDPREPADVLRTVHEALRGGAAGTAIGRNVIGHRSPSAMQQAIVGMVRAQWSLDEALARLLSSVPA
jgi:fructose-bisphosphate aldolase, class I